MPITRAQLQQEYQETHVQAKTQIVTRMFEEIRREITIANQCGNTSFTKDFKFYMHWNTGGLIEPLVTMLREYYIDSEFITVDTMVKVDWSLPRPARQGPVIHVQENPTSEQNIQINITLPSRVQTRAAARAAAK